MEDANLIDTANNIIITQKKYIDAQKNLIEIIEKDAKEKDAILNNIKDKLKNFQTEPLENIEDFTREKIAKNRVLADALNEYITKYGMYKFTDLYVHLHDKCDSYLEDFREFLGNISDDDLKSKVQQEFDSRFRIFQRQLYFDFMCQMRADDVIATICILAEDFNPKFLKTLDEMIK